MRHIPEDSDLALTQLLSPHVREQSASVIQIDNGKSVAAVAICAVLCGLCTAVTVGTVWHSNSREVETQARIRVLQNHVDELQARVLIANNTMERLSNDAARR